MKFRLIASGLITAAFVIALCWPAARVSPARIRAGTVNPSPIAASAPPPARRPALSPEELRTFRPNEAGVVPILEYHEIGTSEHYMSRSRDHFESDLDRLYVEGFRPIALSDYLSNRIDLPAGTSPVVLTFDDARESQFRYTAVGTLDPECAVGILTQFHEEHPDFPLKATFFVLPKCPFEDRQRGVRKVRQLVEWGFEIGNHTLNHRMLHGLSDARVEKEIGGGAAALHQLAPEARIETIAFPGGHPPRNSKLIARGSYKGFHYVNRAGFLAAYSPAPAPVTKHQDRMHIERIVACQGDYGINYWLDRIKEGSVKRYVSDGDPDTTTVPRKYADRVDHARLNGAVLNLY